MGLRVRKKRNASGSISIHIVDRTNRGYKVIESLGSSKDEKEIEYLYNQALQRIDELENNLLYTAKINEDQKKLEELFSQITTQDIISEGDEMVFGRLFDIIGCSKVFEKNSSKNIRNKQEKNSLFRALVLSRIIYPGSKLELINYLEYFKQKSISSDKIYRFLDTLYSHNVKQKIEECVFTHTKEIMQGSIALTFYDVTTLHFESESEDDLRRIGFSKEGKLARPQIQLGLFTTLQGYPLSFEVYEGNKFEGHTLVDILQKFQKKFHIKNKPIVVADKGMLNNANIAYLEENGYKYILAYKIRHIEKELKEKIANLTFLDDGVIYTIEIEKEITYKDDKGKNQKRNIKQRLILTYSTKRAKKDKATREKALKKINDTLNKKNITKSDLKLSYYAKYLDIVQTTLRNSASLHEDKCTIQYKLSPEKVELEERLDGIKGFATNDFTLKTEDVIAHYQNQYAVEKAFRISKTDLRIRPIYHRLENRIKAHILVSFVAYAVYMEFERRLKLKNISFKFSQKLLRKIIEHFLVVKIGKKIIPIKPSKVQQQILKIFD